MKCVMCGDEAVISTTTMTLEKDPATVVFKKVPARVCRNCGEKYLDEEVVRSLFEAVHEAARAGVEVEVRTYSAV